MAESMSDSETPIFFYGCKREWGEFSQFYASAFEVDGKKYEWAEMWMHACKAMHFKDYATRRKILEARTPSQCKKLGRQVKPFDVDEWSKVSYEYVKQGTMYKYSISEKSDDLKALLLSTGARELVEAAPKDRVWGIGYSREMAMDNKDNWGKNLLGKALMEVRTELRLQEAAVSRKRNVEHGDEDGVKSKKVRG